MIARVLPVPAPASTRTGPRSAIGDLPLLGVERLEQLVGARCERARGHHGNRHLARGAGVAREPERATACTGRTADCTVPHRTSTLDGRRTAVTMYSTQWCGYCHRLKSQLDREGIAYDVVDIERVPDAAFVVEQVNRGNQTVPTLVYADGSAQTNPSVARGQGEARLPHLTGAPAHRP